MVFSENSPFNWTQFRVVLGMSLRQTFRPNVDKETNKKSRPLPSIIFSMLFSGLMFTNTAGRCTDGITYLYLFCAVVLGLVVFMIVPDTHDVRLRNLDVLHAKPISLHTQALARAAILGVLALLVVACFGFPALVGARLTFGFSFGVLGTVLGLLALTCLAGVLIWLSLLTIASLWVSLDVLRSFNMVLLLFILVGQLLFSMVGDLTGVRRITLTGISWVKWLPSTWVVDTVTGGLAGQVNFERLALLGVFALAGFFAFGFNQSEAYARITEKLLQPDAQKVEAPLVMYLLRGVRSIPRLGPWLLPDQVYALAAMTVTVSRREEFSRLKILFPRLLLIVFFGSTLFSREAWVYLQFVVISYGFMNLIEGVLMSKQTSHAEAAWVSWAAPVTGRRLLHGIQAAVLLKYFTLPLVLVTILFFVKHPAGIAVVLTANFFLAALVIISFINVLRPVPPLSQDSKTGQTFVSGIAAGIFGFISSAYLMVVSLLMNQFPDGKSVVGLGSVLVSLVAVVVFDTWAARRLGVGEAPAAKSIGWAMVKWLVGAGVVVLVVPVIWIGYLLFVPPAGPLPQLPEPVSKPLPPQENAWVAYQQALSSLKLNDRGDNRRQFEMLNEYVSGALPLNQDIITILDRDQEALVHVLEGAQRPACQPDVAKANQPGKDDSVKYYLLERLIQAQALRCRQQQQPQKAAEYLLAGFAFQSQGNSRFLWAGITGHDGTKLLFDFLLSGEADRPTCELLVRGCRTWRTRLETPSQAAFAQWLTQARHMHSWYIKEEGKYVPFRAFKGFRYRFFRDYLDLSRRRLEAIRPSLETWDFQRLRTLENLEMERFGAGEGTSFLSNPSRWYAERMTGFPLAGRNMASLYLINANLTALECLAAARAFKFAHGSWPGDLVAVFAELNLEVPTDVATGEPVGYRLEPDGPLVWFAGLDNQNNGGKVPYQQKFGQYDVDAPPGGDILFRATALPAHLQPAATKPGQPEEGD
ncbi:MAG: hypothetical protein K1Y36_26025 [Blastocatellia bacterium]|nr:hypothetical protein [Blastocatellia bacterium]